MKFRLALRRVTLSVAVLAVLGGIPAAASAASAAAGTGWIRLGNLSTGSSPVDVYVTSGSTVALVQHDVAYPAVLSYQTMDAGSYSVDMRAAGSAASSAPLLSGTVAARPACVHGDLAAGQAQGA